MLEPGARVAVGMSGGTDSSTAAYVLVAAGYDVLGITLRLCDHADGMTGARHAANAVAVARRLGIAHEIVDLRQQFEATVVEPALAAWCHGETPSPCIRCNRWIKFGAMLDLARARGCTALATGHYARLLDGPTGNRELHRGRDAVKDQSYFLFALTQAQLAGAVFPLGDLTKAEVRARAAALGLVPERHGESQDLCFVPDGDYASQFIARRRPELVRPGPIVDGSGRILGAHSGFFRYTIGQRRGLGLGGGPWYVVDIRAAENTVVVGHREAVLGRTAHLADVNWLIAAPAPGSRIEVLAQLRFNMKPVPATVQVAPDGGVTVGFDAPVSAITPGQATVFYDGDRVLGGGWVVRGGGHGDGRPGGDWSVGP